MKKLLASVAAFVLISSVSGYAAAQCTYGDLVSKNAEKCATKYGAAILKCIKKGVPLTQCDTSRSDTFCGPLSASCTPKTEVDQVIQVAYGGQFADECRRKPAKQALKLVTLRYKRTRTGKEDKLVADASTCTLRAAQVTKNCPAVAAFSAPCNGATSLQMGAGCLCHLPGCRDLTPEEFETQGTGAWESTRLHAESLGYFMVTSAQLCVGAAIGDRTVRVVLRNPHAPPPTDRILLMAEERTGFGALVRQDTGTLTTFNEGGGLRFTLADGTFEVVEPDGTTVVQNSLAARDTGNRFSCGIDLLLCIKEKFIDPVSNIAGVAACAAGAGLALGGPVSPASWYLAAALVEACNGLFTGLTLDFLLTRAGLECRDLADGGPCDRGLCSEGDYCNRWGICMPGTPSNQGNSCELYPLPWSICVGRHEYTDTASCQNTECKPDRTGLQSCGACNLCFQDRGLAPSVYCEPEFDGSACSVGGQAGVCTNGKCATPTPPAPTLSATTTPTPVATPGCGNGILEEAEQCDGADDNGCPGQCMEGCVCNCDDGVPCTQDQFLAGTGYCVHNPDHAVCEGGSDTDCYLTRGCSPQSPGADGQGCIDGTFGPEPDGSSCDDGFACTTGGSCYTNQGCCPCGGCWTVCQVIHHDDFCNSAPREGDPDADCGWNVCSPGAPGADANGCVHGMTYELDGSPCDDGDPCTAGDTCHNNLYGCCPCGGCWVGLCYGTNVCP